MKNRPARATSQVLMLGSLLLCEPAMAAGNGPQIKREALRGDGPFEWSRDGNYFIYRSDHPLESKPEGIALRKAIVRDIRTGHEQVFEIGIVHDGDPNFQISQLHPEHAAEILSHLDDIRKEKPTIGTQAAYAEWQKQHPAIPCQPQRSSPDRQTVAQLSIAGAQGTQLGSRWVGPRLQFLDSNWQSTKDRPNVSMYEAMVYLRSSAVISVSLLRKGMPGRAYRIDLIDEAGALKGEVALCWAPDSRRVAVLARHLGHATRVTEGAEETLITWLPVSGPLIRIRGPRTRMSEIARQVASALDQSALPAVGESVAWADTAMPAELRPRMVRVGSVAAAAGAARALAAALGSQEPTGLLRDNSTYDLLVEAGEP